MCAMNCVYITAEVKYHWTCMFPMLHYLWTYLVFLKLHVMLSVFRHIPRERRVGKVNLSNANRQISSTGVMFILPYHIAWGQNRFQFCHHTFNVCMHVWVMQMYIACCKNLFACVHELYSFMCVCLLCVLIFFVWASDVHVIVYKDVYVRVINSSCSISQDTHLYLPSFIMCAMNCVYNTAEVKYHWTCMFPMLHYLWTYLEIHTSMYVCIYNNIR